MGKLNYFCNHQHNLYLAMHIYSIITLTVIFLWQGTLSSHATSPTPSSDTISSPSVTASTHMPNHPAWQLYLEQWMTQEDEGEISWEETYLALENLAASPIDLNHATKDDLEQLPFLSDTQIEDLLAYIYQYQGLRSWGELMLIESMGYTERMLLPYFTTLNNNEEVRFPSLRNLLTKGKSTLTLSGNVPLYTRKGDENGYLGYRYRHSLRYTYQYSDYLQAGLVGAQDAGEPFFSNRNAWGYDHYSFYVAVRKLGRLKALVAGRYKVKMGLGLVINNDLGLGKAMAMSGLTHTATTIRPHSSRSSANYLQGAAATIALSRHIDLTAFASWRKADATLSDDNSAIVTLLKTGYHRTTTEMNKKNNIAQTMAGANLFWSNHGWHASVSGVFTRYDKDLQPNTSQRYREYYPQGNNFWNISASYGYTHHRLSFNGETATGGCKAIATLNALCFRPTSNLTMNLIQRFYGKAYYSLQSESFAEGGRVQNESGVLAGISWNMNTRLQLSAYTDYAYFPWAKYQAHLASHSWDNFVTALYTYRQWQIAARYRLKNRTKDNADKSGMTDETTQRARVSVSYTQPQWSVKTQADYAESHYLSKSRGFMVSQQASIHLPQWLQATALIGYFHTDDYASRLYTYERGLLYSFSFPAYYGKGVRYALFVRADISRELMLIGKVGVTDYLDRDHISSGLQQINRSSKTDVELQLRWKF